MAEVLVDDPFPVRGTSEPILYGRSKELTNILRHLEKKVPAHISIVGPRYIGKTTLVRQIARHFAANQSTFDGHVYWRTRGVRDDVSFRRELGRQLLNVMNEVCPAAAKALSGYTGDSFDLLQLAFEELRDQKKRVLLILDGFDEVLLSTDVTANNWDNMRLLGEMPSVRFLTCTRRPLVDLCARPESLLSPFFNLFSGSVSLGPFTEEDIHQLVGPFLQRGISMEAGVEKELHNFSGGIPIIASLICKRLWDGLQPGTNHITRGELFEAASSVNNNEGKEILKALWKDCDEEERADFGDLVGGKITNSHDIPLDRRDSLSQRGFICVDGNKVSSRCRVVEQYAKEHETNASGLRRIFVNREAFDANIQALLQLRFSSLKGADPKILTFIRLAIQEIDQPDVVLNQVRAGVERALDTWLDLEFPDRKIPADWSNGWKQKDRDGNDPEHNPPTGFVSKKRGAQCYLLRLVADPRKAGKTRIRQSTQLLIDALQSVGDFGQHREGEVPPVMFGASIVLALIQMAEQVADNLRAPAP